MSALTYTVPELAALLQVSESHVRRMAKAGVIPTLPIPGRTRFAKAVIDAWLNGRAA